MRIAICDDEEPQRLLLKRYVEEWARRNKVILDTELFVSGESFLFVWEDDRDYDLLIFDIEMGKLSGMELAAAIREKDDEIPILFVTGYDKYMLQGFEVAALHYLLKPVAPERLFGVLDRLKLKKKQEEIPYLIAFQDVIYEYEQNNIFPKNTYLFSVKISSLDISCWSLT